MLDFPANPLTGQTFGDWFWDGAKWTVVGAGSGTPSGTYLPISGGTMTGPLTLAGNATQQLQPVTLQQYGYTFMQGAQPAGGYMSSPFPFGTLNQACAFSCNIWPPDQYGRPIMPGVTGVHGPFELSDFPDRGFVTFYAGADSAAVTTYTITTANYDATTIYLSPPLTSTQLQFVQAAVANNNARLPLWPAGYTQQNVGMQIDTQHSPKYTGCITSVASDGSSITVSGWFQQGNRASGQVPSNGVGAYINPCTKLWNMNGISYLDASTGVAPTGNNQCNQITFLEIDMYNYQPAFGSVPGAGYTIGISANSHANMNGYGFVALSNWNIGFFSKGCVYAGFSTMSNVSGPGGTDSQFGFVSQIRSDIAGGHHPFAYYDFATGGGQYRYSVGSSGSLNLGAPGYDNGFSVRVVAPGSTPGIWAVGPDANINIEIKPQGTGYIQCDGDIYRNNNPHPIPPSPVTSGINLQGADGGLPGVSITSYAQRSAIFFRRADNTGASPGGLVNQDLIGAIYAAGFDTSVWSGYAAGLSFYADGVWSSTSHPAAVGLSVCAPNSTITYEQLRMFSSGRVMLAPGATTALTDGGVAALTVSGPTSAFGFVSNVASTISGGHHPFVYTDSSSGQNRFTIASNGTAQLGSPSTDNGFSLGTALTGNPAVIQATGPDANISIRVVAKGTGMVQCQSGVQLSTTGPTWTQGAGAPSSTQPVGSLYSNTSGAVGATLYVSRGAGTWAAVAGV